MIKALLFFPIFIALTGLVFDWASKKDSQKLLEKNIDIKQVREKFKNFKIFITIGFFTILPLFVLTLTWGMQAVQNYYLELISADAAYSIGASSSIFGIPAMFMAILCYAYLVDLIGYSVSNSIFHSKAEYLIFRDDMSRNNSINQKELDQRKLKIISSLVILPLFFIAFYLGVNTYTKVTNDHLINKEYFSLSEDSYSYNDVNNIYYFTKFKNLQTGEIEKQDPYYFVIMKNGYKWSTLNLVINGNPKELDVINFISNKSGVKIIHKTENVD